MSWLWLGLEDPPSNHQWRQAGKDRANRWITFSELRWSTRPDFSLQGVLTVRYASLDNVSLIDALGLACYACCVIIKCGTHASGSESEPFATIWRSGFSVTNSRYRSSNEEDKGYVDRQRT